jgi:hypothetical protein
MDAAKNAKMLSINHPDAEQTLDPSVSQFGNINFS